MIYWPVTLPQNVDTDGYQEIIQDNRIRSDMDMGPPKMRPRFSAIVEQFTIVFVFNRTEMSAFEAFYKTTTSFGTEAFQWTHPRTGATVMMRFVAPYRVQSVDHNVEVSFTLEVLP